MKVGLNLLFLGPGSGGVGRYATELASGLAERDDLDLELFVCRDAPDSFIEEMRHSGARIRRFPVARSNRLRYLLATFVLAPIVASLRRVDVFHSPANVGPFMVPGVKTLITVHDLIWLRAGRQWDSQAALDTMRRSTLLTVPRVDRLITDSIASRDDIEALLGPDLPPIDVVALGVSPGKGNHEPAVAGSDLGIGGRQAVLCIAQKRPYKRQDVLVRALAELPEEVVLVLPGSPTDYEEQLRSLAQEIGVSDRVMMPGWVSEEQLESLYASAACVALPSELEGFGLPVLEAMARGVPVVCSDRASLPEVAGDAALVIDPDDQEAVVRALDRAIFDPGMRKELIEKGLARAAQFTWGATTENTVGSYRAAIREAR